MQTTKKPILINIQLGIEQFEDDEEAFFSLVSRAEILCLDNYIKKINDAMRERDWEFLLHWARCLSSAAGIFESLSLSLALAFYRG